MKYSVTEFAQEIRKLYPGDYDDLSDNKLVELWLKKYPNDVEKINLYKNEKESPIIYPKSKLGGRIFKTVMVLGVVIISYFTNPSKKEFIEKALSEYAKINGIDQATSSLANVIFGEPLEDIVVRHDYYIFSTYQIEIKNNFFLPKVNVDTKAIGLWGNIFFYK
jgi:hypothetical protein